MRFLLAGSCIALTAVGLAVIQPARSSPDAEASGMVRESRLRADARFLSSPALEGEAPGMPGDRLARAYVAARFEAIGLEPGAADGSWFQPADLDGTTMRLAAPVAGTRRSSADVIGRLRGRDPQLGDEVVLYTALRDRPGPRPVQDGALLVGDETKASVSEVAALLSIAEAFADLPQRPRRSVVFAAVAAEGDASLASGTLAAVAVGAGQRIVATVRVRGSGVRHSSLTAVEDVRRLLLLGAQVANSPLRQAGPAGEEGGAAQQKALAEFATRQ